MIIESKSVQRLKRCCSGFTLLEVMVSLSIIAITLTTLFGSQSQSLRLATEIRFNTTAALLSNQKIAQYQSGTLDLISDSGDFGEEFPGYSWNADIQKADLEVFADYEEVENPLYRVELTVSWNGEFSYLTVYYGRAPDEMSQ